MTLNKLLWLVIKKFILSITMVIVSFILIMRNVSTKLRKYTYKLLVLTTVIDTSKMRHCKSIYHIAVQSKWTIIHLLGLNAIESAYATPESQ